MGMRGPPENPEDGNAWFPKPGASRGDRVNGKLNAGSGEFRAGADDARVRRSPDAYGSRAMGYFFHLPQPRQGASHVLAAALAAQAAAAEKRAEAGAHRRPRQSD